MSYNSQLTSDSNSSKTISNISAEDDPVFSGSNGDSNNDISPDYAPNDNSGNYSFHAVPSDALPEETRARNKQEDIIDQNEYYDSITKYYEYKDQYETTKERLKTPFVKLDDDAKMNKLSWQEKRNKYRQIKPPCINCKRPVGTTFSTEKTVNNFADVRILKAKCGDNSNPCALNIQISVPFTSTYDKRIESFKRIINEYKKNIIILKNNLIFGYGPKESYEVILDFKAQNQKLSEFLKGLEETYVEFELFSNNLDKNKKLKNVQTKFYNNLEIYNNYVNSFKTSNDVQFLKDAVSLCLVDIIPEVEEIMHMKYSYSGVEYDETDNTFHLCQPKYTLNEDQENFPGRLNEQIISFEIKSSYISVQKHTRIKKSNKNVGANVTRNVRNKKQLQQFNAIAESSAPSPPTSSDATVSGVGSVSSEMV